MITISNTEVVGWEHAIRGMRNPLNSWDKSDSQQNSELITTKTQTLAYADQPGYDGSLHC